MKLRRAFLWSMIVSLSLAAFLGVAALLFPDLGPTEEILVSTLLFAVFSLTALCCALVLEKHRLPILMWIGIAASAAALLTWLTFIWLESHFRHPFDERCVRTGFFFTLASVWIPYVGLLTWLRLQHPWARAVLWAAIGSASILTAVGLTACISPDLVEYLFEFLDEDFAVRLLGAVGIVGACCTVLAPILWKIQSLRHAASRQSVPTALRIQLVCPRCGSKQSLPPHPAKCTDCGLRITVTVEEPRCECGYLLYQLASDQCPECGRTVPESLRWHAVVTTPPPSPDLTSS